MPDTRAKLYAESFAPWCERARWALDHHRVAYDELEQVPLLAEVSLRVALRRPERRVTVPLLVHGEVTLMDSDVIARYAETLGGGAPLFPEEDEDAIAAWMTRSEAIMTAGRALLLARMAESEAALAEQLPPFVPDALRPHLGFMARLGVKHLARKYATGERDAATHEETSRAALGALRDAVAGERPFLLGDRLTYADVTMAAALQFVLPVDDAWIRLGPATREAWTNHALAADFGDVLAWRDRLYATQRHARAG